MNSEPPGGKVSLEDCLWLVENRKKKTMECEFFEANGGAAAR